MEKIQKHNFMFKNGAELTLLFGVLLAGSGQTMIFSILPPIAEDLGLLKIQVGLIFTFSALLFTVFSPFWGRQSDVHGRRRFFSGGLLGFGISMLIFAGILQMGLSGVLPVWSIFIALVSARAITGISSAATATSGTAYIADTTAPEKRALGMARYTAAFGLGSTLGPAIASSLVMFGPAMPLYLLAICAMMTAGAVYAVLPKPTQRQKTQPTTKLSFLDGRIRKLLIFNVLNGFVISLPIQVIGFYILDRVSVNQPVQFMGLVLSLSAGASLFAQMVLIQHFKIQSAKLLKIGPLIIIGAQILIIGINHPAAIAFGMLLTGLGTGVLYPALVAIMSLSVKPEEQGAVSGLASSTSAFGFVVSPLIGFGLYDLSPFFPFIAMLSASFIQLLIIRKQSNH